ncbi:lytic transglycosylase domain-containing protein [Phenylobacterium deserti]|uniref:Conjugal transfer protein n=1 Tax=Phenylobacterium deserti TaxID=1914756 RepID=A0A328AF73_9CAUL|nr:lytic transglycosylase domain-containing protein [Phenylobacterium deserti]RAK52776.1 conjugal transfer protein [Phenylobacterium deserti]
MLDPAALAALAAACAPQVAPVTLVAVAQVESGLDPLAIGINGAQPRALRPRTAGEAAATARRLIAEGRNLDLGLAQINVRNLGWLGLSVEAAFDPCRNLAAAARVLQAGYRPHDAARSGTPALHIALSRYNTGRATAGLRNGYVAKVLAAAARLAPRLAPPPIASSAPPAAERPWDVFATRSGSADLLVTPAPGAQP